MEDTAVKTNKIFDQIKEHKKLIITIASILVVVIVATIIAVSLLNPNNASIIADHYGETPNTKFSSAKDALESANYFVTYENDDENLEAGVDKSLIATYFDLERGEDFLYITAYEDIAYAKLAYEALARNYISAIEEIKTEISIVNYKLEHYEDELTSNEISKLRIELEDLNKRLRNAEEHVLGRSGNIVWYGTEEAAEDSWD